MECPINESSVKLIALCKSSVSLLVFYIILKVTERDILKSSVITFGLSISFLKSARF